MIRLAAGHQVGFTACRSKLAEAVEKIVKAELIQLGWTLERTRDLEHLLDELILRHSDLVQLAGPLSDALADAYFTDRYPGFDLDAPDWPVLSACLVEVEKLVAAVKARV